MFYGNELFFTALLAKHVTIIPHFESAFILFYFIVTTTRRPGFAHIGHLLVGRIRTVDGTRAFCWNQQDVDWDRTGPFELVARVTRSTCRSTPSLKRLASSTRTTTTVNTTETFTVTHEGRACDSVR
eukprot:7871436-Pyramimonas_sp.AAC.1